jgi:hypothetical protein
MRGVSLLLACFGIIAALFLWRALVPFMPVNTEATSMALRLGLGTAALLPAAFVLAAMVATQMVARFAAFVLDPTAGQETHFLLVNQRAISNSVEQMAILVPALLALAAAVPAQQMPEIAAAGAAFAIARFVFWAGYLIHPLARAPGMAGSAAISLSCLMAAAWKWLH